MGQEGGLSGSGRVSEQAAFVGVRRLRPQRREVVGNFDALASVPTGTHRLLIIVLPYSGFWQVRAISGPGVMSNCTGNRRSPVGYLFGQLTPRLCDWRLRSAAQPILYSGLVKISLNIT